MTKRLVAATTLDWLKADGALDPPSSRLRARMVTYDEWQAEMKKTGIPIGDNFKQDPKTGKVARTKKHLPANKQIASKNAKRIVTRAQAIGIRPKGK